MATRDAADANRAAAQRSSSSGGGGGRLALIIAGVVGFCAVIALVVTLASGGDDEPASTAAPGADDDGELVEDRAVEVTVTGTALDAYLEDVEDLAVGKPMPELSGTGLDGNEITIGPDDGPAMIVFIAHWCPHCQKEVPVITQWLEEGGGEGVEVRAVNTAFDPPSGNWPSSEWLAEEGWPVPTLLDPTGQASVAVGQGSFPFFITVDADGNVAARTEGELTPEQLDELAATATASGS